MSRICYYLCCCCCCGRHQPKEDHKTSEERKQKTLEVLEKISPIKTPTIEDPMTVKTSDMTKEYRIPLEGMTTEEEVIEWLGYRKETKIGSGGFAQVFKGFRIKEEIYVAIKRIEIPDPIDKKRRRDRDQVLKDSKNELYVLENTRHPHIIRMIEHFMVSSAPNKKALLVVLQLASGGSLTKLCNDTGPFSENKCRVWFAQMLNALVFMHSRGIAHRDLKLSNILLDETNDILISDFGLSRLVYRESQQKTIESNTFCGTPPYMAPEVLVRKFKETSKGYNAFKADVWSLGVILYRLFNLEYPFPKRKTKAYKLMVKGKWKFSNCNPDEPSLDMINIMKLMFQPDPNHRASARQLADHTWVKDTYEKVQRKVEQTTKTYANQRNI